MAATIASSAPAWEIIRNWHMPVENNYLILFIDDFPRKSPCLIGTTTP
jgi:hypothetical protein